AAGAGAKVAHRPTQEVADLYLNGVYLWQERTYASLAEARATFEKALSLDPAYAPVYSGLAVTYELQVDFQAISADEGYPLAKATAEKALQLDPSLGEAESVIADVEFFHEIRTAAAMARFERAVNLAPYSAQVRMWYADALISMGRPREALHQIDAAQTLDPTSSAALAIKGLVLFANGQPREAEQLLLQVKRNQPDYLTPYENLLRVYLGTQEYKKYIDTGEAMFELLEFEPGAVLIAAAREGLAKGGYKGMAEALLAAAKPIDEAGEMPPYNMAHFYGMVGDWKSAADSLQATVESGDGSAYLYSIDPSLRCAASRISRSASLRWDCLCWNRAFGQASGAAEACRLAVEIADAFDRVGKAFVRHLHGMAIGVDHFGRVGHDRYMALPEHEVAAPCAGEIGAGVERLADSCFLHRGIAQNIAPGHAHGKLHQPGAVYAETAGSAPQIGRVE
ncbi:tetratricopeptide repeat protein, partial [Escherichia coli]|nr:tetratricopeptide repeat protein [Escherichia coli]